MGFFDKVKRITNELNGKYSDFSYSKEICKSLNEVIKFFKECTLPTFKFPTLKRDIETGGQHIIERGENETPLILTVTISHLANIAIRVTIDLHAPNAKYNTEKLFENFEKEIKDCEKPTKQVVTPTEDYSKYSFVELLEIFDEKIKILGVMPNMENLMVVKNVRLVIDNHINALSLAERGKFSKPLSTIDMYINTLNTQLANVLTAQMVKQYTDIYIPQMRSSISEIASTL